MCTLSSNARHVGHAAWNHLFLLGNILISFYYVESLAMLIAITMSNLAVFAGVEGW